MLLEYAVAGICCRYLYPFFLSVISFEDTSLLIALHLCILLAHLWQVCTLSHCTSGRDAAPLPRFAFMPFFFIRNKLCMDYYIFTAVIYRVARRALSSVLFPELNRPNTLMRTRLSSSCCTSVSRASTPQLPLDGWLRYWSKSCSRSKVAYTKKYQRMIWASRVSRFWLCMKHILCR